MISFQSLSTLVWLLTLASQLTLVILLRPQRWRSFTAFRFYCYWYAGSALGAFLTMTLFGNQRAYFIAYYVAVIGADILSLIVVCGLYRAVFGPSQPLPRWVPERTLALSALALSGALALALSVHVVTGGKITRTMVTLEQIFSSSAWACFIILFLYSLALRTAWPRRAAGIFLGFVLYLTINIVAVFVRARAGKDVAAVAGLVGQFAYLLSSLTWVACFWEKEPVRVAITAEQVEEISLYHDENIEALSWSGVRVNGKR